MKYKHTDNGHQKTNYKPYGEHNYGGQPMVKPVTPANGEYPIGMKPKNMPVKY